MYYISAKNGDKYCVTDTVDGTSEWYTAEQIYSIIRSTKCKVKGVSKNSISVVNASKTVIQNKVDLFSNVVRNKVFGYSMEQCEQLAGSIHFKKKIKDLTDINQVRQVTYENVYPESVQEVVRTASDYTNEVHEIDATNPTAIKQALVSNVCLVLQHKTNGALTAFICTANIDIMDKLYEPMFVDRMFLTKTMYDFMERADKIKDNDREVKPNPNMLNVFSASLRFRKTGVKHDGLEKEISSIFYSVNIPNVLALFVLDNPATMGDTIMTEFKTKVNTQSVGDYKFDMNIYNTVCASLKQGSDIYYANPNTFIQQLNMKGVSDKVDVNCIINKYHNKYGYMEWLRSHKISFKD